MGILDSFERSLERAVNGVFARTFRSGLQPVEITAALRREVDTHASPVSRDRTLVPNRFTVRMAPADHSSALTADSSLAVGMLQVDSVTERSQVSWAPTLEIDGARHALGPRTVLGRGSDADIVIDDPGISRHHLEILWDGRRAEARDLGSTNGSTLNGERFGHAPLGNDSVLQLGRTQAVFRLLARADRSGR